ncbi:hypothetical protein MUGA111182_00065 [Mucilaginibacter galii]|uniref:Uncharacterized protein n=1 Tax=Mucilaginibacter galii TaxID=2005073 RepID=A0A917J809_9SPHI|nr:hypothetical protein [Mucilaginibacter galii]GGI49151.1 hypothetical protein GCM10011425_03630 [Mucilaginibacter galii]
MMKSTFAGFKPLYVLGLASVFLLAGFSLYIDKQDTISWSNQCLFQSYDSSGELKLKKWELTVTADAFMRFRKTFQNGKQEYYSFNIRRFKDMDYLGNTNKGIIRLSTLADDIIVQTYNDRKGNVDSMSTTLKIPVKNMGAERLDSLYQALTYLKSK